MNDLEILQSYERAKDKNKQVKIIADLSGKSISEVIESLKRSGVDGRHFQMFRPKNSKPVEKSAKKGSNEKQKINEPIQEPIEDGKPVEFHEVKEGKFNITEMIASEIADINRCQYELDMRRAELHSLIGLIEAEI